MSVKSCDGGGNGLEGWMSHFESILVYILYSHILAIENYYGSFLNLPICPCLSQFLFSFWFQHPFLFLNISGDVFRHF